MSSRLLLLMRRRGGGDVVLLDDYSTNLVLAYSLRQLLSSYSGSLIRVREDSGNTEADIGFDSNGNLDTTALLAHCGVNSGYITKWYDQSASDKDLLQASAVLQPRIVNSGVVDTVGGKPCVVFDNSNDLLANAYNATFTSGSLFFSFATTDNKFILFKSVSGGGALVIAEDGSATAGFSVSSGTPTFSVNGDPASWSTRDDSHAALATGNQTLLDIGALDLSAWSSVAVSGYNLWLAAMSAQELLVYSAAPNVSGIRSAINNYWGIY